MPTDTFDIDSPAGYRLSGRLELPEGTVRGWALFAHCFTCGKDGHAAVWIARGLAAKGIGTLRFDFAGIGTSEGSLAQSSFAADMRDLIAAAGAMAANGMTPSILIGHSLGGAAALAAASEIASIAAVATIAAPFDITQTLDQFDPAALAAIEAKGEADAILGGRTFRVSKAFLDDLGGHDLSARIAGLHRPLMILHAPHDETVDIDNATRIFLAAHHPKSFVSLDGADHMLNNRADTAQVAGSIAAWADRYLPPLGETRDDGDADVVAEETGAGRYQVAVRAGGTRFLADEPVSVGGLGTGPGPYDLLGAALAACTTMTLRLYTDQKGWAIGRIRTAVGHIKRKGEAPADLFTRRISIDGNIDDEHRAKLLEIADKCPVHRTLIHGSSVETEVGGPPAPAGPIEAHAAAMEAMVESVEGCAEARYHP